MTERIIWPLMKARVVSYEAFECKIAIGGSTTIAIAVPQMQLYDIKVGDLLTIYTEVLLAKPSQTSVQ